MDNVELLFFDTFSHDISEELNLDLVQFPKPVYISEVRIIPLGARVQADFPGGVRLGATNPSQFEIEFFVNDLSKPGASTFESLGGLEYKQNVHIQLECERKQIPTDGLVLRGWYTTITLAVYGSLTKSLTNPPEARPAAPVTPVPPIATKIEAPAVVNAPPPPDSQAEWYFESPAQAPASETCPAAAPSPTVQPIQTIESSQKAATFDLPLPEAPQWTEEAVEPPSPQKTPKRPSSPPPESLVSLSPEPISAEEEDGEKEPEEPLQADPVEPFEPILSDEELMADDIPAPTADFPCDTLPKDLYPLEPPELLDIGILFPADVEDDENTEKIRETLRFLGKSVVNFNNVTGQEKETFVHNCESLCVLLGSVFHCDEEELQDMSDVVNVGLDIELARAQPQPAYKVRHVKVGVRLAEAVCNLPQGDDILLKIDAPTKLLSLCMQENVALPVKLAALRALDAALASPKVVEKFLMSQDLYQINLYRLTLVMLDEAKLARLKYALASLLRKIHVYELLAKCRTDGLNEMMLAELTHTFSCAATLMAQPKRQLPASMQMEFEREPGRNPRRHLISYFKHHGLLQQLLYILTSPESSENLIRTARTFITRLTDTGEGLTYILKTPDVTKALLKALRYQRPGLGSEIAWKLQVMQCLMQIKHQNATQAFDWHTIRRLHSFLTYEEGLRAIVAVLSIDSYLETLIPLLAHRDLAEFSAEVLSTVIRYSDRVEVFRSCATVLLQESRCQGTLRDVTAFLSTMAAESNWNYSDVSSLVGIIRKNAEKASSLPGELIAACRILNYLIFPPNDDLDPMEPYIELKHRNALTQFFAADGLTALIAVISNLTAFYYQPFLHRAAFIGRRGLALMGLLLPCIKLLRALLERLVKCMATEFKDLTPVVPLLSLYALVDAMPPSRAVWRLAEEIAETLLLFTRAVDSDGAGNVAKSLWTQMLGEVLKMISANPCNFVPGLKLLARLLPPILRLDEQVDAEDVTRTMGLRKLWSAHLQAQAVNLTDTLRLLCASWNETLLSLLSAVCKQLSDLAAPTALLVGRCLLDQILAASPLENHAPTLALLGDLTLHGPVKATLLTLMSPTARSQVKADQKYLPVVEMMCTALKNTSDVNVQREILDIFYTLCDHTLSIVQKDNNEPFELWLTHSVPSKEPLLSIISVLIDILANASKYSISSLESTLRILISLAEHNYGLYHVKTCLENNLGALKTFIEHVAMLVNREGEEEEKINPIMTLTVAFLESLITCSKFGKRTLYLRLPQLAAIIVWEKGESHPLEKIKGTQDLVSDLKAVVDTEEKEPIPEMLEPLLPAPETLLNQFAQRSVKGSRCSPSRTRKRPLSDNSITSDGNSVDLIALATELLPADFNLLTATQLLCSKARKDEIVEPAPVKAPVSSKESPKPPTGPRKPPFVTPMRGRAQFVSSRGGLVAGGVGRGADPFRSRPPNTSRPPSLHVDDFVALETCGAQPTGPTGYNKLSVRGVCPPRGVISGSRCRPWGSEPRPPYLR